MRFKVASRVIPCAVSMFVGSAVAQSNQSTSTVTPPLQPDIAVIGDYTWRAEKTGQGTISLMGLLPTAQLKSYLAVKAGAGGQDQTKIAGGAPDGFIEDSLAAIEALDKLAQGAAGLAGNSWAISGLAKDEAARAAAFAALASAKTPAASWIFEVSVAAGAEGQADGSQMPTPSSDAGDGEIAAEGDAPEPEQDPLAAVAMPQLPAIAPEVAGPEAAIEPAVSAEEAFAAVAMPELPRSAPEVAVRLDEDSDPLAAVALPALPVAAPEVEPTPEAVPVDLGSLEFAFNAEKLTSGGIVLGGHVPTEGSKAYLSGIAGGAEVGGVVAQDGAAPDFMGNAVAGLQALAALDRGVLRYEARRWSLSGETADGEALDAVGQRISALPESGKWTLDVVRTPPIEICRTHVGSLAERNAILFGAGSARITENSGNALDELASYLGECPETIVHVEGHTDADGDDRSNLALSVERAEAVVAALIARGVRFERLYAVGYGESLPIASNQTSEGKRRNRRIAFRILEEHE